MKSSARVTYAHRGIKGESLLSGALFVIVLTLLVFASAVANAQTQVNPTTNTILFSGQQPNTINKAPVGGIVLEGTAISAFTGRPVRHLWVGDQAVGPCRMDPELDAPGPWDINQLTCTYNVNRAGAPIPFGGDFQYDAARHFLYFADKNTLTQGVIRIAFDPTGDNGHGALDLSTAFTLAAGTIKGRKGPFLGGTGCPIPGTGTRLAGTALSPLGDLWVSFADSGDIFRFNSPATATEFGFGTCAQFEQLVATSPDGALTSGLAFIGHDLWSGDGTSPFVIPNADTTCLVPPNAACSVANGTVIPTLPQVGATGALSGDQQFPNINGNNLYYGVGSDIAWIGNVAAGAAGQTFTLTYMNQPGIAPAPNPPLAALSAMVADYTDPANIIVYSAEDPVILINPLEIGNGRWWQTTQTSAGPAAPGAPLDVVAVAGESQISLSWSPAQVAQPVTSYTVRNTFISAGAPLADITVNPPAGGIYPPTSILIPGLTDGVSYAFEVSATNNNGTSPFSAQSNIATPPGFGVPSAPSNVIAQAGDTQAFVTWTVSASNGGKPITSYTITVLANGVPTGQTVTVPPPSATSNTDSTLVGGLTNGTSYTFTVHATNIAGNSPESAPSAPITTSAANTPTVTIGMTGIGSVTSVPQQLSYTITVTNTSNFPATNVNITNTLNTVASNISSISRDGNGKVTVTTSAPATFAFNNQVQIAGVLDPSFNGTFSVVNVPSNTSFTFNQAGPAAVSSSGTATLLPASNIVSINGGLSTCTSGGPGVVTFSCNVGFMDPGTVARVTFLVQMTQSQAITNTATVSGTDFAGTAFTTNSASFTTNPPPPPPSNSGISTDMQLTGKATKGSAVVNTADGYTWVIANRGPAASAPNVAFTDILPNSLAFSSVTTTAGTCTGPAVGALGGTVQCNVPSLALNATFTVTVNVIVKQKGTINNTGSVAFDGVEAKPGNETVTVKITGQ